MPRRWNCTVERALQSLQRIYVYRKEEERERL